MKEMPLKICSAAWQAGWQLPSAKKCDCELLCATDVPVHQKVPFILNGYRPEPESPCSLFRTIFSLHNETGNMWTHLLGFGYFVLVFAQLCQEIMLAEGREGLQRDAVWVLALVATTAFCLACSFSYHLCNCAGRSVKECMYRMDLAGIVALIGVSYFTGIALAFHCCPRVRKFYLFYAAGVVLALAAPLVRAQLADLTRHFIICAGLGLVPAVHFVCVSSAEDVAIVVPYILTMFGCYGAGSWFFVQKWPERRWPGRFDLFGHSHQVWHMFVLLAAVSWVRGSIVMREHFGSLEC